MTDSKAGRRRSGEPVPGATAAPRGAAGGTDQEIAAACLVAEFGIEDERPPSAPLEDGSL
ncbi:hypothetical protein ABT126_19380 [Streptomyces sp. NPDC002012]|uniref:hypothetical protein n=1 Tax=Streptomyces sp. NPDC002012 TaxID=3154532 RepID=UPI00332D6B0A